MPSAGAWSPGSGAGPGSGARDPALWTRPPAPQRPAEPELLRDLRNAWRQMDKHTVRVGGRALSFPKLACAGPRTIVLLSALGVVVTVLILKLVSTVSRWAARLSPA